MAFYKIAKLSQLLLLLATLLSPHFAAQAETYILTFNGTWVSGDIKVPANYPASAHFTDLVGATHSAGEAFWREGQAASTAVEAVAELGFNNPLKAELVAKNQAGTGGPFIQTTSLFGLPSSTSLEFEVEPDMPFISLISMIAPSPDWFVGVSNLSLMNNGQWINELTVELKPYDAGTEDGTGFSLGNPASSPIGVITKLFEADSGFVGRPTIGTLNFKLRNPPPMEPLPPSGSNDKMSAAIPGILSLLLE